MTEIRTLDAAGVGTLLDWAAAEGWNPGLEDAMAFRAADAHGFFGAFVNGRMAAGMAAVAYDQRFGFIGLYICHPDFRGRGLGRAVWDHGMAYLGSRTVGLDGVPEQQGNYARMGFVAQYETMRWSGELAGAAHGAVRPLRDVSDIAELDRRCFPAPRDDFLAHWTSGRHRALVVERAGRIVGWAVSRPCREGFKIGPLFAEDDAAALALLEGFSGAVSIDVPVGRTAFVAGLRQRGFVAGFRTARMYRGPAPEVPGLAQVYGVTSLELG